MHGIIVTWESLRAASSGQVDLVVYLGQTLEPSRSIVDRIKRFVDKDCRSAASICLVAPAFRKSLVDQVQEDDRFVDLKSRLGVESYAHLFGRDGEIGGVAKDRREQFHRRVLTRLVRARHGVLEGAGAVHYVKPSGRHADQFIRIGNALASSAEIEVIAWACLPHLPMDVTCVYTDTGAINIVAAAILDLIRGFEPNATGFSIDSFGSYDGLKSFEAVKDGLWLISATTSGGLAEKIREMHNAASGSVISLFSLGVSDGHAVCRLDVDKTNPDGFQAIKSYDGDSCRLCRAGSTALWLSDEQFLVADAAITEYLPKRVDMPKTTLDAVHQLIGHGVFRVAFPLNRHSDNSDIFLDLEPHVGDLLSDAPQDRPLARLFQRRVRQSLPAAVDLIVTLDDDASVAMGNALAQYVKKCGGREVRCVRAPDLRHLPEVDPPRSVVVAAASVASGTSVIDVSRDIRSIDSVESICYLVLVDRSATDKRASQTSGGVVYTEDAHRFDYHVTVRLPLPEPSAMARNPWDEELEFVQSLIERDEFIADEETRECLEARKGQIEQAKSKQARGLKDGLFWKNGASEELGFSRGFVFLPTGFDRERASQADVYSVIRALLHSLRTVGNPLAKGVEPPLKQHPLHRKVIDVGMFYRFNDPVLRAAILRAAAPGELDYSHPSTKEQSASARLLVIKAFRDRAAPATEFALALALGRLRLSEEDKQEVLRQTRSFTLSPVAMAFLRAWEHGRVEA
jgi:hypothetical protein